MVKEFPVKDIIEIDLHKPFVDKILLKRKAKFIKELPN
jgi:hypothetical protein